MNELATRPAADIAPVPQDATLLSVIASAAANPNVDVNKMERLLAMQEKMMDRQAESEFNISMVACQSELPKIWRNAVNPHTNSRYAKLEQVNDHVIPVATQHGFALSFGTDNSPLPGKIRVTCRVSHRAGHSVNYFLDISPDTTGAKGGATKTDVQGLGSSVSYARRYLTMMIFNLTLSDDDNDGNARRQPKVDPLAPKKLSPMPPASAQARVGGNAAGSVGGTGSVNLPPTIGTPEQRVKMFAALDAAGYSAEQMCQFANERGLGPLDPLTLTTGWPLAHVPTKKSQMDTLLAQFKEMFK